LPSFLVFRYLPFLGKRRLSLYEVAAIDRANSWQRLRYIT